MHAELPPATRKPLGLAFEIPDLIIARAVAKAHGLRLAVEIDHHTEHEELEEVLALYPAKGEACRWLIWRSATAIVVQPMPGRPRRFASLQLALAWLAPDSPEQLTDIQPSDGWPALEIASRTVEGDRVCPQQAQA